MEDESSASEEQLIDPAANKRYWLRRPPFFRSRNIMDCGAACLRMITESYGYRVDYDELCKLIRMSQYGSSLYDLMAAAETVGFRCMSVEAAYDDLRRVRLPAIVHLPDEVHFVVLWTASDAGVYVGDPATGPRRYRKAEFLKLWKGVLLLLEPTPEFYAAMAATRRKADDAVNLKTLWPFLARHRGRLLNVALGTVVLQLLTASVPVAVQVVFDTVLPAHDQRLLTFVVWAVVGIGLVTAAAQAARDYLILVVATQVERALMESMYRAVLQSTQGLQWRYSVMDLLVRFGELGVIRDWTVREFIEIAVDVLMLTVYWSILCFYSADLALALLVLGALFGVTARAVAHLKLNYTFAYWRAYDWLFGHLKDTFSALSTIKAHSLARPVMGQMLRHLYATLGFSYRAFRWGMAGSAAGQLFSLAATGLVLWIGAQQVFEGTLTIGQLAASVLLATNVIQPLRRVADAVIGSQQAYVSMHRVGNLIREQRESREDDASLLELPRQVAHVFFHKVSFRYDEDPKTAEAWALRDVSLELKPGEVVGVVGLSGCGKSTLVRLLLRLHDPQEGQVLVNGCNVRSVSRHSLRSQIALVTQEVNIFQGTIYDNITCGRQVAPEKVVAAARVAGAYDFIQELPYLFDTRIGDRGLQLSGGQRQRLVIARALVADPSLLILDEAMAALDPVSESQIHERLREVMQDRTTLIITHRIQSLQHADRIVVLHGGEIVQNGPHHELIEQPGLYRDLAFAMPSWRRA